MKTAFWTFFCVSNSSHKIHVICVVLCVIYMSVYMLNYLECIVMALVLTVCWRQLMIDTRFEIAMHSKQSPCLIYPYLFSVVVVSIAPYILLDVTEKCKLLPRLRISDDKSVVDLMSWIWKYVLPASVSRHIKRR